MTARSSLPHPFFAAPATAPAARRLLLVSYSFPPDSNIGALRWEKLLAYASSRGWHADVLMMDPATAEIRDDSRLANLPPGTRLFAIPRTTARLRRLEQWLIARRRALRGADATRSNRGASAAPNWTGPIVQPGLRGRIAGLKREYLARMSYHEWSLWAHDAARVGIALAQDARYDVVVSSGPPQMAHEAAREITRRTGIPMVMDLRDQFFGDDTQPPQLRSHSWLHLTKKYERRCVATSRLVAANTQAIEEILRRRYPAWSDRFLTVMNGADPDVHSAHPFAPIFTVTHAGSLYNGRDPRPLLKGCRWAIDALGVSPEHFRIHLFGDDLYEDRPVIDIAREEGVEAYTLVERVKPRGEAITLQEQSAVLVVLPQFQAECIPGKVFDYVQLSSWVLALTDAGTATELLLRGTTADLVAPGDTEAIGRCLAARFREFRAGVRPAPVNADHRFDRAGQGRILFDAIEERCVKVR